MTWCRSTPTLGNKKMQQCFRNMWRRILEEVSYGLHWSSTFINLENKITWNRDNITKLIWENSSGKLSMNKPQYIKTTEEIDRQVHKHTFNQISVVLINKSIFVEMMLAKTKNCSSICLYSPSISISCTFMLVCMFWLPPFSCTKWWFIARKWLEWIIKST